MKFNTAIITQVFYFIDNQLSTSTKASPINIPLKPMRPPMRSSIEGLNQEIEVLVLKSSNTNEYEYHYEDKVYYTDILTLSFKSSRINIY